MPADVPALLIVWTARLAVAGYLGRVACDVAGTSPRLARWFWTAGLGSLLLHITAALHVQHHWSQSAAWEHVRQQTHSLTGWNTGVGLVVNYAFTLLWIVDGGLWWRSLDWPRQRWVYGSLQTFYAFIIFNATVVFGPRGWMIVGVLVLIGLMILQRLSRRH